MDDLVMTFLIWDLRIALALAVALGVIVVLQGAFRGAVALAHRVTPVALVGRAAPAGDVVRVSSPRRTSDPVGVAR